MRTYLVSPDISDEEAMNELFSELEELGIEHEGSLFFGIVTILHQKDIFFFELKYGNIIKSTIIEIK